jgi:hypothetical protein
MHTHVLRRVDEENPVLSIESKNAGSFDEAREHADYLNRQG